MSNFNPLLSGIKTYIDPKDFKAALEQYPPSPDFVRKLPYQERASEYIEQIDNLFILGPSQYRTAEMIQRMITSYYRSLTPSDSKHIERYYHNKVSGHTKTIAGLIQGQPGLGKSMAIQYSLFKYPQIIAHKEFPHFKGPYLQVVWFSISILSHTRRGFALELAQAWNDVFLRYDPSLPLAIPRDVIDKKNPDEIISSFIHSAINHNLGLIHFDEIQTLFRSANNHDKDKKTSDDISVRDDITLGKILGIINIGIPVLISCTADGTEGLNKRGSISQRLGSNFVQFDRFKNPSDPFYITFINNLMHYQYTDEAMPLNKRIYEQFHVLTAGIPRIMVNCFMTAQRRALQMSKRSLDYDDLLNAHLSMSDDIKNIIRALHNNDQKFLRRKPDYRYEKLLV